MPLDDVNNAFWEIAYSNWHYFDRAELVAEASAMDAACGDRSETDTPCQLMRGHGDWHKHTFENGEYMTWASDDWVYPEPPVWPDNDLPYFNGEDFS